MNDFLKRSRREVLIALLLLAAVWAVFGPSVRFGFINYDDGGYVSESPVVLRGLTPEGVRYAFTSRHASGWYPLTTLSLMLDTTLYGTSPGGYHFTNVVLHALAVLALFAALRALTGSVWRSALVAAVFAIHPLRAESVAWISSRKDVLSGLFFFLTLWAYARYARGARYARMSNVECRMSNVERGGGQKSEIRSQTKNPPRRSGTPPQEGIGEAEGREQRAGIGKKIPSKGGVAAGRGGFLAVWWYAATILFFACALMSKPTVVTLPALLLVLDFWPLRRMASGKVVGCSLSVDRKSEIQNSKSSSCRPKQLNNHQPSTINWRLLLEKLPLFLLSAAVAAGTMVAEGAAVMDSDYMPFALRAANALRSYAVYMIQTVWPSGLIPFYPHPARTVSLVEVGVSLLLLAAVSAAALWLWRRRPYLLAGWLWYLGMLVPVSGLLMQAGSQAHADRYTYLPQIGLLIMLIWCVPGTLASRRAGRMALSLAAAAGLAVLAVAGALQTGIWRDSMTLWQHTLKYNPDNTLALTNLSDCLLNAGRYGEAAEGLDRVLRVKPCDLTALNNRGNAAFMQGRMEEALSFYDRAVRADPSFALAFKNSGLIFLRLNRPSEAADHFRKVLALDPADADAGLFLEQALCEARVQENGQGEALAEWTREAVRQQKAGDLNAAVETYRRALEINPYDSYTLNNLAWILATATDPSLRNGREAVQLAERAVRLSGGKSPAFLDTLAAAYAEAGRLDEAVKTAERAAERARTAGDEPQAQKLDARIRLYRQGMPFRQ